MELKKFEEAFKVYPVGVRYICEFCSEGEQTFNVDKYNQNRQEYESLFPHKCTNCGKEMLLPIVYPKVEYLNVKQYCELDEKGLIR